MPELGVSGLRRWSGVLDEEFLPRLRGDKALKVYREMRDNDALVGAMMYAIETLLRGVEWRVEPAEGAGGEEAAEFVESCLHDMSHSWDEFIAEALSMLPYGWSYHEVIYKERRGPDGKPPSRFDDARIGWRKLPIRAQDTREKWEFDEDGGIRGMWQLDPLNLSTPVFIPIEKALLLRTTAHKNSPEGRSLLRNAYRPWYQKVHLEAIEGIGLERNLAGLPVGYVPMEWMMAAEGTPEARLREELKDILASLRKDEQASLLIPSSFDAQTGERDIDVKLLSAAGDGGTATGGTGPVIARKNQEIAMTILADVLLIGHEQVGTQALAQEKGDMFRDSLNALNSIIARTMNRHAIPRLMRLNGWSDEDLPELRAEPIERVDLQALGEYVSKLSGAGILMYDGDLEQHLRERGDLPERPDDIEPGVPALSQQPGGGLQDEDEDAADEADEGSAG